MRPADVIACRRCLHWRRATADGKGWCWHPVQAQTFRREGESCDHWQQKVYIRVRDVFTSQPAKRSQIVGDAPEGTAR